MKAHSEYPGPAQAVTTPPAVETDGRIILFLPCAVHAVLKCLHASWMQETAGQKRTIKSIKAREAELRQQGLTGARAGKIAAGMVTGVKKKKQKKKVRGQGDT